VLLVKRNLLDHQHRYFFVHLCMPETLSGMRALTRERVRCGKIF
jgi:hypothetical protein